MTSIKGKPVAQDHSVSDFQMAWRSFKVKWLTRGKLVPVISSVVIGGIAVTYFAMRLRYGSQRAHPTTQPNITATDHSAASGSGTARSGDVSNGANTENGDATNNSNNTNYNATANSPGGKAISAHTVNENNVGSEAIEQGLEGKPDDWRDHKKNTWLSDSRGDYIILPFTASRQTKITEPIALTPFAHNRRAVVELHNIPAEWQSKFAFQVKAMRYLGDQNRQDGSAKAGVEFTILRSLDGDQEFY